MALGSVYKRHLPENSIRILRIASDGKTFSGSLVEFQLDEVPYFAALSWCWTSRRDQGMTTFTCNGQQFPISKHLYALLENITPNGVPSSIAIWVDAICINQSHIEEKDFHIPRMHEIYGKAQSVIVWLGESGDDSELAMDAGTVAVLSAKLVDFPDYNSPEDMSRYNLPLSADLIWKAFGRLCERDWFYRTWVVQEVALARKIEILCGRQWLSWESLVNLISAISRTGLSPLCQDPSRKFSNRPNGIGVLLDLAFTRTMHQDSRCPIDYLLRMVRLKEVTKPIDKVYGLLGLIDEDMRNVIKVNYTEYEPRYWEVYLEMAKCIIAHDDQSFWLISMAPSKERPKGLPSWCPNLNSILSEILDFSHQNWRAGILVGHSHGIRMIPNSPNIRVQGFILDEVQDVIHLGSPNPESEQQEESSSDTPRSNFTVTNNDCFQLTQKAYPDINEAINAYSRTLIVNTWADGSAILSSQRDSISQTYIDCISHLSPIISSGSTAKTEEDTDFEHRKQLMNQYLRQLGWWRNRPFFTTKNSRIGRGAISMKAGDVLCAFYGVGPVFILRPKDQEMYELVGDAYLHGCMDLASLPLSARTVDREFIIA